MRPDGSCIFCRKPDGGFTSVEHIVPESLGNISGRHVLPKGVVCDRCNNYLSVKIEGPLLNHISFRNLRAKYQTPTKRGKIPFVMGYALDTDIEVGLRLNKQTGELETFATKPSQKKEFERLKSFDRFHMRKNILVFPMEVAPPEREMSRFLAKMAFEVMFSRFRLTSSDDETREMVSRGHYDNIRKWVRYGNNFDDWPYHYRAYIPEETLMKHPETQERVQIGFAYDLLLTNHPETYFIFSIHGHEFAINLGGPSIKGYEKWLDENDHVSALVEKQGQCVQCVTEAGRERHYLVPLLLKIEDTQRNQ